LVDGFLSPIAVDVHFEDRGVVHDTVDGGERHSLVAEYRKAPPFLIG
jgi:hypothetical protein